MNQITRPQNRVKGSSNCLPVHTDHVTDLITATCIYVTPEIQMKCCNIQVIDLCLLTKDVVEVV